VQAQHTRLNNAGIYLFGGICKITQIAFIPYALSSLAAAHLKLGELAAVHEALARALHLSQQHQLMQYLINTIRGYGVSAWTQGHPETAVTLLTFSFNHPASPPPIVWRQAPQLLGQLEKELLPSTFQAAQEQGDRWRLGDCS